MYTTAHSCVYADLIKAVLYSPERSAKHDPLGLDVGTMYVGLLAAVFRAKGYTLKAAKKQFKLGNRNALSSRTKTSRPALFPGPLPRNMTHTVLVFGDILL